MSVPDDIEQTSPSACDHRSSPGECLDGDQAKALRLVGWDEDQVSQLDVCADISHRAYDLYGSGP